MMVSLRRGVAVFAGLLAAGWLLGARADGPAAPGSGATPAGVPVEVDLAGGKLTGTFAKPTIAMAIDYGAVEVSVQKLKTLDLADADGGGRGVTATLTDKSHLNGTLAAGATLDVTLPDGTVRPLAAGEVEQVRFLHPKDTSWTAVIVGLLTLTLMEVILGVDNVIFLAIQAGKLPEADRPRARTIGLAVALGTRIALLLTLNFLLGLTKPVFVLPALPMIETMEARGVSWRDLILLAGGVFLIGKSVSEMHEKLESAKGEAAGEPAKPASFASVILTIAVIDIVFSLDSVITAVGMVDDVTVMITAMVIAMGVMLGFAGPIGRFVDSRPTVKILALSFLILIGVMLVAEGLGQHIDKGYIYFAMAFAVGVEVVNLQLRKKVAATPAPAGAAS